MYFSHISSTDETHSPLSRHSRLKQLKNHLQRDRRKLELGIQCDEHEQRDMRCSSKLLADAARDHPFGTAVSILRVQEETLQRYAQHSVVNNLEVLFNYLLFLFNFVFIIHDYS